MRAPSNEPMRCHFNSPAACRPVPRLFHQPASRQTPRPSPRSLHPTSTPASCAQDSARKRSVPHPIHHPDQHPVFRSCCTADQSQDHCSRPVPRSLRLPPPPGVTPGRHRKPLRTAHTWTRVFRKLRLPGWPVWVSNGIRPCVCRCGEVVCRPVAEPVRVVLDQLAMMRVDRSLRGRPGATRRTRPVVPPRTAPLPPRRSHRHRAYPRTVTRYSASSKGPVSTVYFA